MSALETNAPELNQSLPLEIQTERLVLRRPKMQDCKRFAELLNNYNVAGNLARVTLPYSEKHAQDWMPLKSLSSDPHNFSFAITTREDGLVGNLGFHSNDKGTTDKGTTEIGYWLGEPFWGRGIMTEATRAAIAWFFAHTNDQYLASGVFHFNMASLAIQHKLGFVETGRSSQHCAARGIDVEHIDTELNKEDFEASI